MKNNTIEVLSMPKNFDYKNISEIEYLWKETFLKKPETVGVDFSAVESFDTIALGYLVKFYKLAVSNDIKFHFFNVSSELLKVFERTKINRFIIVKPGNDFN